MLIAHSVLDVLRLTLSAILTATYVVRRAPQVHSGPFVLYSAHNIHNGSCWKQFIESPKAMIVLQLMRLDIAVFIMLQPLRANSTVPQVAHI